MVGGMIGTNQGLAELNEALTLIRPFIQRNPGLPSAVAAERFAGMLGRDPDPAGLVAQVLRDEPHSADFCQLLASPIGQTAMAAFAFEFPQWRLVFQVLPTAANAICQDRRQQPNGATAGLGALALGLCLVLYAWSVSRKAE